MGCTDSNVYDVAHPSYSNKFTESARELSALKYGAETLVTAVADQKKKHNLSQAEIFDMFEKSKGSLQKFFHLLSERVTQFYDDLSNEVLQLLNAHKVTYNETKVLISEQVLIMALDVLEVVGKQINFSYNVETFHYFNRAQSNLLGYLKMKYPRAGNVFVSSDLSDKFKSFDFVQNPKNDILAKFNIFFNGSSQASIVKQVKIFFNALMDQLDEKFPVFKSLMEEQVFKYEQGEGENKKSKILNYKIGRKIPQNTSKFVVDDTQQLTITSPQIFRTIVKWVQDLEDWFKSTEDQINSRDTFKVYKTTKTGNVNNVIAKDEIDELPTILKRKIKQQIGAYKQKLKDLRKQMDIFNINLLKILYTTQRKQKYVPLREAKIIKYAMLNTKIVSWMLSEMLIYILHKLIEVGQSMEDTKVRRKMDLIKFTVTDLMRAQVVGNKKQILKVYTNIQKLQKNNEINIIKIKNRLGTSLNDAMIIFTIKQSKLICELQLILSEGGSEIERLKNIQFLNHMLYELERSPYGVLSEIAVILGYKDNKINFQSKIGFQKNSLANFDVCKKSHKIQTEKIQKKPFLCIQCTEFYLPLQNIFDYTYCESCYTFQCCKCAFSTDQKLEKQQIHTRFVNQLEAQIFTVKIKPKIPKQITIQKILKRIYPQKVFFRNIFPRKAYYEIKPKDFINFIKNKQYIQATGNEQLQKMQHLYILLVQFRGSQTNLTLYYWNQNQMELQNCYEPSQVFLDLKKVCTSYYDFIVFFKAAEIDKLEAAGAGKFIRLCLKPEENIQNIKRYRFVNMSRKNNVMLVLKVQVSKTSGNIDGLQVEQKLLAQKKDFVYDSLQDIRKTLPDILSVREHFQMKNVGITSGHLDYFKTCSEKGIIKSINLSDNKIASISAVLENCENIEELIVAKNFIKQIKIKKKLSNLTKLIAYGNFINTVQGLQLTPALQNLNLQNNKLKNLKSLNLPDLKQLNISNNKINSFTWVEQSQLPKLQILILQNSGISFHGVDAKLDFQFNFPALEELNFSQNMANKLVIKAERLVFLDCSKCSIKNLTINSRKIQVLKLQKNEIQNLQDILANRMSQLKQILCDDAGTILKLPQLDDVQIIKLDLSNCGLTDVSNLVRSSLIKIQELILDGNQNIKSLPSLKFQNLKKLSIKDVHLNDLSFVENSTLPLLEELEVTGEAISGTENYSLECPSFKIPKLKKLIMKSLSFSNMSKLSGSQFSALEQLIFEELNSQNFPVLNLANLKKLSFKDCKIENVEGLHNSQFKSLQNLDVDHFNEAPDGENQTQGEIFKEQRKLQRIKSEALTRLQVKCSPGVNLETLFRYKPVLQYFNATDNKLKLFPTMQLKNVKILDFSDCQIQNIANLTFCKFESLQKLNFTNNQIKVVPQLNMKRLKYLTFENNKIHDVKQFQKSSLPSLQFIDFDKNSLKQFPTFKFENLKQMQIGNNPIQNLQGLQKCKLNSLQKLLLQDCKQLVNRTFPIINLQKCKSIKIIECNINNIDNLEHSSLPELVNLQIVNIPLRKLPVLKMPAIKTFKIQIQKQGKNATNIKPAQSRLEDISNLASWQCPKLQTINIQNSVAKKLPKLNLQSLITLDLQGSDIQQIQQFKLSILPSLSQINLSYNKSLDNMAFPNTVDHIIFNGCNFKILDSENLEDAPCKIIELSKNKLEEICQINTTQLEFLNLESNMLTDIGNIFKESPQKLKNLSLKSNRIKNIPEFTFPQLNYLHISNNQIQTLRIKKKNFPSLIGLYAQNNKITTISYLDIGSLTSINLNKNQIQQINFFNQQYIETSEMKIANFRIQGNKIKSILYLPNISNLYLKGNNLENIDWLANCQTDFIAILSLSQNKINNIKGFEINNQDNNKTRFNILSQIDLSSNSLKQFQIKNIRFPSLDTLNLSKNQIDKFPEINQASFPNLLKFNLSDNAIRQLPNVFKFNKLRFLDLSNNKLTSLVTKELIFKDLKELNFQGNLIKELNGLQNIKSNKLEKLNLSSNLFTKLIKITHFVALKEFKVDKNQINQFQDFMTSNINDWTNLKFIYLIRQDLPDKIKQQIRKKIHEKMGKSQCRNVELVPQTKTKISKGTARKEQQQRESKQKVSEQLSLY